MENILKPKGMLCNRKLHASQLVDPVNLVDIDQSTSQQVNILVNRSTYQSTYINAYEISILQVKVDVQVGPT